MYGLSRPALEAHLARVQKEEGETRKKSAKAKAVKTQSL